MLRLAVIVLLLANAGYYAWSQGLLRPLGYAPQEQSEPQRMNQQIRPETLQILKANPSKTSSAAPPGSTPTPTPTPTSPSQATAANASPPPPHHTGRLGPRRLCGVPAGRRV